MLHYATRRERKPDQTMVLLVREVYGPRQKTMVSIGSTGMNLLQYREQRAKVYRTKKKTSPMRVGSEDPNPV